jgi:hypothetical protein
MLTLDAGYFSARLGETTPIPASVFAGGKERYLGIAVGADPEMSPRQTIDSAPYALVSDNAVGDITPTSVSVGGTTVIDSSGKVGVGTAIPGALFNVNGIGLFGTTSQFSMGTEPVQIGGLNAGISLADRAGPPNPRWVTYAQNDNYRIWNSTSLDTLMIGSSGVLELITDPNKPFAPHVVPANQLMLGHIQEMNGWDAMGFCGQVNGPTMCSATNGGNFYWGYQANATTMSTAMQLNGADGTFIINSPTRTLLQLNGTTGNLAIVGTLSQGSSRALKKDIHFLDDAELDAALQVVEDTPVATYRYKTSPEDTKVVYGIIAEDSRAELTSDDGKALNISSSVGILLASIKAQQTEIRDLEDENSALKARLDRLEEMVQTLARAN